jgi:sulfite oxidase
MAPAEPNHKPFELLTEEEPYFPEEREGWKGYIEWEKYPEKKKKAAEILAKYDFPVVSNPVRLPDP